MEALLTIKNLTKVKAFKKEIKQIIVMFLIDYIVKGSTSIKSLLIK